MRRVLFALLALAASALPASAACPNSQGFMAYAFETITVSSTALGFTAATFDTGGGAPLAALVTVESQPIRFRADAASPTTTVGHPASAGQMIDVCGEGNVRRFRMIRTGTDSTVTVTYFR